ncbi:MAG: VPLPA-CTERM sorting domain-containing protein [Methylococcales bacterium]|nr:VPLPA-CTERM sorting domain-containing protein [Methylococcales bacterium]
MPLLHKKTLLAFSLVALATAAQTALAISTTSASISNITISTYTLDGSIAPTLTWIFQNSYRRIGGSFAHSPQYGAASSSGPGERSDGMRGATTTSNIDNLTILSPEQTQSRDYLNTAMSSYAVLDYHAYTKPYKSEEVHSSSMANGAFSITGAGFIRITADLDTHISQDVDFSPHGSPQGTLTGNASIAASLGNGNKTGSLSFGSSLLSPTPKNGSFSLEFYNDGLATTPVYGQYEFQTNARLDFYNYNTSPVPVPAAIWLMGSGLLGLIGFSRRKQVMA